MRETAAAPAKWKSPLHEITQTTPTCLWNDSAAFRNHMHWSELIGGDVMISPPCKWQMRYNASDVTVAHRIETPVNPRIVEELLQKFPDFGRAYNADGLTIDEFDSFPPTRRTLRQFIEASHDMCGQIRDLLTPNPDKELA